MSTPLHHGCDCEHCQIIAAQYDYLESLHKQVKNTKGRSKPQAIRQAKARTKSLINKISQASAYD
jgi:hypothetical protein